MESSFHPLVYSTPPTARYSNAPPPLPLGEAPVVYAPLMPFSASRACSPPPLRLPPRHLVRRRRRRAATGQRPRAGRAARRRAAARARVRVYGQSRFESRPKRRRARARVPRRVVSGEQPELVDFVHEVDEVGVERRLERRARDAESTTREKPWSPSSSAKKILRLRERVPDERRPFLRRDRSRLPPRSPPRGIELRRRLFSRATLRGSPAGSSGSSGSSRGVSVGVTIGSARPPKGKGSPRRAAVQGFQGFREPASSASTRASPASAASTAAAAARTAACARETAAAGRAFLFSAFSRPFRRVVVRRKRESFRLLTGPLAAALVASPRATRPFAARTDRGGRDGLAPRAVPRVSSPRRVSRARRRRRRPRRPARVAAAATSDAGARAMRRPRRGVALGVGVVARHPRGDGRRRSRLRRARARTRRLFRRGGETPSATGCARPAKRPARTVAAPYGRSCRRPGARARASRRRASPRGARLSSGTPGAWRTVRASHAARLRREPRTPSPRTRRRRRAGGARARVERSTRSRSSGAEERREAPNAAGPGTAPGDAGVRPRAARRRRPPPPPPRPPRARPRRRLLETKPPQPRRAAARNPPPEPRGLPGPLRRARGPPPPPRRRRRRARMRDAFVGLLRVAPRWSSPPPPAEVGATASGGLWRSAGDLPPFRS